MNNIAVNQGSTRKHACTCHTRSNTDGTSSTAFQICLAIFANIVPQAQRSGLLFR
jgi:hypothetical protein